MHPSTIIDHAPGRVAEPTPTWDHGGRGPTFAELLEAAATRGRGTPESLAHALGVCPSVVHDWLRGAALPDPPALRGLAEVLGLDALDLLAALERQRR